MAHAKDVETQKFGMQFQNIQGCHERLRVNRVDLAKELEKTSTMARSHQRHDQDSDDLKNQKNYLTVRGPNPCYTLTLDAMICELSFV